MQLGVQKIIVFVVKNFKQQLFKLRSLSNRKMYNTFICRIQKLALLKIVDKKMKQAY
jgi:hypothetical protein